MILDAQLGILLAALLLLLIGVVSLTLRDRRSDEELRQMFERQWQQTLTNIDAALSTPEARMTAARVKERSAARAASLHQLCITVSSSLQAPAAVVSVLEEVGECWLAMSGGEWLDQEHFGVGLVIPLEQSYSRHVVASGAALAIRDATHDLRLGRCDEHIRHTLRAYLGAPVLSEEGKVVGALCVFQRRPRRWNARDRAVITSYARLATL